jgi:hypothetical protein
MTRSLTETRRLPRRFDEPGVVGCDGQIFEPLDLWQNSLQPPYQERGFR